ncbi:MAG: CehA/McbA family metallohydrolase [Deltaproteobacteria bacterium]|nr:CehA/McbA family metallohydrolase [Deltaproteobacteria bacterium]
MPAVIDGPRSPLFTPLPIEGNFSAKDPAGISLPDGMERCLLDAPIGPCVCWGIPFEVGNPVMVKANDEPFYIPIDPVKSPWFVFMHAADIIPLDMNQSGFVSASRGSGQLGVHSCDYIFVYSDGTEEEVAIRRRYQISEYCLGENYGEISVEAVHHAKPRPLAGGPGETVRNDLWGFNQMFAAPGHFTSQFSYPSWNNWIWAWQNPCPEKAVVGLRLIPVNGMILLFAISAGCVSSYPLRWQGRRKLVLTLPAGEKFDPILNKQGLLKQIQLDLGQVISAKQRPLYPNETWEDTYNNRLPEMSPNDVLVEYSAHPEALFHLSDGRRLPLPAAERPESGVFQALEPSEQTVLLRAIDSDTGTPVSVKLHVHGVSGEYLAPMDRHRIPNPSWFQDYTVDYVHRIPKGFINTSSQLHHCTYIPGETRIKLPRGNVYVEVSKGFEIRPIRKVFEITPATTELVIEVKKVLAWREKGWVTADTHVHFLSPTSAGLEGAGEGINVVNLLASQWGEMMSNVGDFDGKTTFGSRSSGGDGEYLVRVGTENRQHVLGHISLLGYTGDMIKPLCTAGPAESAIGDPVEILLTEWAIQCKKQEGLVVVPHFPNPRLENAATIVSGNVDAIEMTSVGSLYRGINPYSLSDWYRYLNCGYFVPAVGGTDKMSAETAVGTIRTYAKIDPDREFTYDAWKDAVRSGNTFVTYGPLMEFSVEGKPPGSRLEMSSTGATVDIAWEVASVTVPISRVELVVNGEIRESVAVSGQTQMGSWRIKVEKSAWLALLVRGHYPDKPEIITAHSSPVMISLEGSSFMAAADALTILEQIEGALAFLDTVGIRAEDAAYKRMRLVLTGSHRKLHNRLHQLGFGHPH